MERDLRARWPSQDFWTVAGGVDYAAVSVLEKRFEKRLSMDKSLTQTIADAERMLNVET